MGYLMKEAERGVSVREVSEKGISQKKVLEEGVSEKRLSTHVKTVDQKLKAMTVDEKLELIRELKRARIGDPYKFSGQTNNDISFWDSPMLYIFILYAIYQFFFHDTRPNKLFKRASRQCVGDPRVKNMLGEPIKAFGKVSEERKSTGLVSLLFCFWRFMLGWKKEKVSFFEYNDIDGRGGWKKAIRVMFYLQGPTDSIGV